MELERKKISFEVKEFDSSSGVFEGYASTWGLDLGNDQIIKGAFANTITKRKERNQVKLLPLHQWTFPIGKILDLREDEKGLFIRAKLLPTEGELGGKNAKMLMQEGVLNEMSIGFTADDTEINESGTRIIKSLDLFEISLVLFGMNPETHITSMKSILENQAIKELQREIEEIKEVIKAITEKQILQEIKNLITEVKNNGNRTNSTRN
jgi:HK97 family phage prohead protease